MADNPDALLIGKIARLRMLALQAQARDDDYVAIGYARAANDLAQSIRGLDAKELVEQDYHNLSDFELVTIISLEAGEAVLLSKSDPRWPMHRDRAEVADAIWNERRVARGRGQGQ
jgi:hypothetical protein